MNSSHFKNSASWQSMHYLHVCNIHKYWNFTEFVLGKKKPKQNKTSSAENWESNDPDLHKSTAHTWRLHSNKRGVACNSFRNINLLLSLKFHWSMHENKDFILFPWGSKKWNQRQTSSIIQNHKKLFQNYMSKGTLIMEIKLHITT